MAKVNGDKIYIDSETADSMLKGQDPRLFAPAGINNYDFGPLRTLAALVNSVSGWKASIVSKGFVEIEHVGTNYTHSAFVLKEVIFAPNSNEAA
jgi:hypothetical protein